MVAHASPIMYELLPSKHLPQLDLSRCLGGELLSCFARLVCRSNRVVTATSQDSTEYTLPLERAELEHGFYPRVTLVAYNVGHILAAAACVVPKAAGLPLGVVGLLLTLPGSLCGIALLRFDVMKLQVRTYEFWFYLFVSSVSSVLLARGFGDVRASIAVVIWFGNFHTIAVDANTKLSCYLVEASAATVALSIFVLLAMETSYIPDWQTHAIQSHVANGSPDFETNNLISNGLTTMMIILCRNLYRRHCELVLAKKINCSMMRCLNLRCQIAVKPADLVRLAELDQAQTLSQKHYYTGPKHCQVADSVFPIVNMHNIRIHELYDGSQTLYPVQLNPLHWRAWERAVFAGLGCAGLAITASVFGVYPSPNTQPTAIVGLCCTLAFMIVTASMYQLKACLGIVLSFDFLFLSAQFSLGLWSAGMLFKWDIRSVALASMWLWLHWVITIDALLPLMKEKIGFNTKFLLVPVLLLFLAAQASLLLEMVWLDHWGIQDRVLVTVAGRFTIKLLPFLVSRIVMSSLWSLRVLWRVIHSDNDDVVILLGRIAFLHHPLSDDDPNNCLASVVPSDALSKSTTKTKKATTASTASVQPVPPTSEHVGQ